MKDFHRVTLYYTRTLSLGIWCDDEWRQQTICFARTEVILLNVGELTESQEWVAARGRPNISNRLHTVEPGRYQLHFHPFDSYVMRMHLDCQVKGLVSHNVPTF